MNSTVLLDKGMKCLTNELGLLEAEQFIYTLLSQPFDYTEWRKHHLLEGMSIAELSAAADKYCKENVLKDGVKQQ
ncbi:MAG: hypothetical protein LBF81_02820 [Prevotellaceae bacterium]|jgi:hypothetical protein|nr:hypothetical protein [Prevotellaceae bacterium]